MLLDGYIRVSHVGARHGDSFISPVVQRDQIQSWIESNGDTVGEVFEELDESGARSDRPLLMRVIERAEAGESGGVVVAKLDRFGRSVIDGLRAIQRIQAAGARFVSVQDGLDIETATGKLVLQILFSIGEWELERVRNGWDVAKARAIARGVYVGRRPFGYRAGPEGRLLIDAKEAPIVREIFERRAGGESFPMITRTLNELGYRSMTGVPFRVAVVMRMTRNPAYRGEARHGPHRNPKAHPPIVEPELWESVQVRRRVASGEAESLLAGLIRCAACGATMRTTRPHALKFRYNVYRCGNTEGRCSAPAYARGDLLDPLVEDFVFRRRKSIGGASQSGAAPEEAAVTAAEAELAAYRDEPLALSTLGAASFAEGLGSRQRHLEQRLLELAAKRRAQTKPPVDLERLQRDWPQLRWVERRRALGELIDCVVVRRGREPLTERAWIFRRGRGPVVKRNGRLVVPFDPTTGRGERLRAPKRWAVRRLTEEMEDFLADKETLPPYLEFSRAGRGRLHAQMLLWGGPYYWAQKFGVQVFDKAVCWTEERVEAALAPFLAGRDYWPARSVFMKAGLSALFYAVREHGGIPFWAKRFGLPYQEGYLYPWPPERIERELLRLSGEGGKFPTRAQLRAKRAPRGLEVAIRESGGIEHWADRLGLRISMARRRRQRPAK